MEEESKPTLESVLPELNDPAHQLTAKQLAGLSDVTPQQASILRDAWQGLPKSRRRQVMHELVEMAEDNVELDFDAVFVIALRDSEPEIRREAIQGLWEHSAKGLISLLLDLLQNDIDAGVRADAALALGRFVMQAEFDSLANADAERIESTLRRAFHDPTEPVEVRARALESLGARSEGWVSDLIDEAFDSDDRRLRISAVHAMGRSADSAWLSSVIAQLDSDDAEMRFEAATAAGSIGEEEATPYILPLLHDEDAEVRMATIFALGEIGGEEAKVALRELLANGSGSAGEAIRDALAEIEFAENPLAFDLQPEP